MPIGDIDKIHDQIIRAKKDGILISKTLKHMGIARSTYYRIIDGNGNDRWREIQRGKMVMKKKPPKKKELSGGNLQTRAKKDLELLRGIALKLQLFENHRKNFDAKYIDGRDD